MNRSELVMIGYGGRTPLGFNSASSAAAVRCGISAIAEHQFMIDRFGQPMKVTGDTGLDPGLTGIDRLSELIVPAAREALACLTKASSKPEITLLLSLGEPRPGYDTNTGQAVVNVLCDSLSEKFTINQALHRMDGHAGGIAAMGVAQQLIVEGQSELVLVGGVDSYLFPETLEWLDEIEQLHSEENIYGFCPGEAAGVVLITHTDIAQQLGIVPLFNLASVGFGIEKNLIKTEDICLGDGLAAAFSSVADSLGSDETIDRILCDMNGERYRGNEYGFAVLKNTSLFRNAADVETPADCWGDVGAASGPLYVCLIAEAEERGYSKGPLSLIWTSSESGQRSAAVLRRPGRN